MSDGEKMVWAVAFSFALDELIEFGNTPEYSAQAASRRADITVKALRSLPRDSSAMHDEMTSK